MRSSPPLVGALLALAACTGNESAQGPAAGVAIRDSAGVRIVENHDSAWTEETRWRLDHEPDLVIGSFDGTVPGTDFGRTVTPRLLGDRVVVLDATSDEVRLFDSDGVFERALNRRGEGPNELMTANGIRTFGDTAIAVHDSRLAKILHLDLVRGETSSVRVSPPPAEARSTIMIGPSLWRPAAWFSDGSYLLTESIRSLAGGSPGAFTDSASYHRMARSGEYLDSPGPYPLWEMWRNVDGSAVISFSARGSVATGDGVLIEAYPRARFEYAVRRPGGELVSLVRAAVDPIPVTPELRDALRALHDAYFESNVEDASASARRRLESSRDLQRSQPLPEFVAPFDAVRVTDDGYVLAELTDPFALVQRRPGEPAPEVTQAWAVFDPQGRWLGTLQTPLGLTVADVDEEYVLGVRRDEFDVPYVERWRIVKPQ